MAINLNRRCLGRNLKILFISTAAATLCWSVFTCVRIDRQVRRFDRKMDEITTEFSMAFQEQNERMEWISVDLANRAKYADELYREQNKEVRVYK